MATTPEHDTTPETPESKHTVFVSTGKSDPPPGAVPGVRPAAGAPPPPEPVPNPRRAETLPSAVKARSVQQRKSDAVVFGAAVFVLVLSAVIVIALRLPPP